VALVLDETRLGLHWREPRPWYAADYPANTLILRSPSKIFFANGQKLSLLLGAPRFIRAVERAGEALVGSLAGNAEGVALAYFAAWRDWRRECAHAADGADEHIAPGPYLTWRAGVLARLRANLGHVAAALTLAGYILSPVDSGPYVLASRPRDVDPPLDACRLARRHGVLLMDARYFLHERPTQTGFRVNLAADGAAMRAALARVLPGTTPRATGIGRQ
jgi:DNA-binding transcriptional MocR family regulator